MTTSPARGGNFADLVREAASRFGDRPAVIGDGAIRTWAALNAAADTGAARLLESGARRGDRVLVALPTSADLAAVLIAVARAGLVAVPIDPTRAEPIRVARRVQARIGIAADDTAAGIEIAVGRVDLAGWWSDNRVPVDPIGGGEELALLARASRSDRAVMIPHRAVLAAVAAVLSTPGLGLRADDRALLALPLFHLSGFVTAFLPLTAVGGAAVIPSDSGLLTAVHDHRVTILPGSPAVYRQLLRADGAERALSTVRLMTSGAAPLQPEDFSAAKSLTGQNVWEGYGISESTSVVATSLMTGQARPGSVGLPVAGLELRIVPDDDDLVSEPDPGSEPDADNEAPTVTEPVDDSLADVESIGEVGQIAIRGPMLFLGYWPDAADGPDDDGWYRTADVGYTDDHGELHLVDRLDDTFVVAGFTVYPREIERVLADHPYVAEAAVVGLGSERGTTVVAVITPRPGTHPTDEDLAEFLAERLPVFKRPTVFHLTAELPRTELGRVDRRAALQVYADVSETSGAPAESPALTPVDAAPPADTDEKPAAAVDPQFVPEAAADLDQLGRRLPSVGSRGVRGTQDDDDDLFGEDFN